jgi:density-regulated protein
MAKKKASKPLVEEDHVDSSASDSEVAPPAVAAAAPTAISANSAVTKDSDKKVVSFDDTLWVEVCLSGKKKPSTYCRGLAAHGHKLPATAAQLKKMVGAADVVKEEADCLEFQGDVVAKLLDVLVTKLNVSKDLITDDKAASIAKAAKAASSAAAASSGAATGGVVGDDEDDDSDDDITITRKRAIDVAYCPTCTFPAEMCEYSGVFEKCKPWLKEQLDAEEAAALDDASEKGRKRRILTEKEKVDRILAGTGKKKVDQAIVLDSKTIRGKKKITTVAGLDLFGVNLTDASRDFKKTFSCGAGVVEEVGVLPMIEVQGHVVPQLMEMLPRKYPQISIQQIFVMEGKKKVCATEL